MSAIPLKVHVSSRFLLALVLVSTLGALLPTRALAQNRSVTLAWDVSPESSVSGYFVYVTRFPLQTVRFDAGRSTQFTPPALDAGAGYYFAVAAYTASGVVGPRSAAIFYMVGSTTASASSLEEPSGERDLASAATVPPVSRAAAMTSLDLGREPCVDRSGCYTPRVLAVATGQRITALSALAGGRVAFVEDGRRVRIVDGHGTEVSASALTVESSSRILNLVSDPEAAGPRIVYVALATEGTDGEHTLTLVRYRELGGVLAEAATLVVGLALPASGSVALALDPRGRIYVAMPGRDRQDRSDDALYGAKILRFEPDGAASPENGSASPVFAPGYDRPTTLAWTTNGATLWLAGSGASWAGELAALGTENKGPAGSRLPNALVFEGASVPTSMTTLSFQDPAHAGLAVVSDRLVRLTASGDRVAALPLMTGMSDATTLVSRSDERAHFVVVRAANGPDLLLRLDRR